MQLRALCVALVATMAIVILASSEIPDDGNYFPAIEPSKLSSRATPVTVARRFSHKLVGRRECNSKGEFCKDSEHMCGDDKTCCPIDLACVANPTGGPLMYCCDNGNC